mmetsp:Transcript_40525/g.39050  ORF Transcript_40525/g.39050 Transcript_40525/m.39050 type:complete len:128 (+) Transcript_40525:210-593(+)|eukprot:CAMPEP_0170544694 /NCGR_PEP_ID=MMETSP0211-20121228/3356_1 /TAXON_ID=311385 /ORGANISM="Pseudokeronopsis sp., Strain OXSARD2" /LENGTH=127 /DNA_ID=CAMNT_0010848399 /DNA_START=163 /DNA_END=546 /DNA_ORIENTATION=-
MIVDFACGTGLSGEVLKREGLVPTYGIDASQKMLDLCKDGVYKKKMRLTLGLDPLPAELDKACDFVMIAGGMGPEHCPASIMESTLDILKKGGIFTFDIRAKHWKDNNENYPNQFIMQKLIEKGKYV